MTSVDPRVTENFGKLNSNPNKENTSKQLDEIISFFKTLSIFLVIAILLRASVVEAFKIPSGSMIPTLRIGDHILVSKFNYGFRLPFMTNSLIQYSKPQRGDIVVFTRPDEVGTLEDESSINIIKRVMGIPGDIIEVNGTNVYINNQLYPEEYARWEDGGLKEGNFGPIKVPEGNVFLMGDNRDHSRDSRFWEEPFLDMRRIKGRAFVVYWSWHSFSRIGHVIK